MKVVWIELCLDRSAAANRKGRARAHASCGSVYVWTFGGYDPAIYPGRLHLATPIKTRISNVARDSVAAATESRATLENTIKGFASKLQSARIDREIITE